MITKTASILIAATVATQTLQSCKSEDRVPVDTSDKEVLTDTQARDYMAGIYENAEDTGAFSEEEWAAIRKDLDSLGPPWVAVRKGIDNLIEELATKQSQDFVAEIYERGVKAEAKQMREAAAIGSQGDAEYTPGGRDYTQDPITEKEASWQKKLEAYRKYTEKNIEEMLKVPTK